MVPVGTYNENRLKAPRPVARLRDPNRVGATTH